MNSFMALSKLLSYKENRALSYADKLNLFFVDFSLMPLLCYENYLTTFANQSSTVEDMSRLALCADMFSLADRLSNHIFTHQSWGLLSDLGRIGVVSPSNIMQGFIPFTKFPEVLGKFSVQRKSARLIRELKENAGHHLYASKMSVQTEFIPLLYMMIIHHLEDKSNKEESVALASKILHDLNFTMDQFKENVMGLIMDEKKIEQFTEGVDTATKTSFTKCYNQMTQSSIKAKKSKGGGGGGGVVAMASGFGSKFDPDIQDHASDED